MPEDQLTMRDRFAMAALPALLNAFGSGQAGFSTEDYGLDRDATPEQRIDRAVARWSYRLADAMLGARQ